MPLLLAFPLLMFVIKDEHRAKLICGDFIQCDLNARARGTAEIQRTPEEQPRFRRLRGIETVKRAVIAPTAAIGRLWAETGIAQLIPPERPVYKEAQGGLLGPLPI
jgi:hypothetical protein